MFRYDILHIYIYVYLYIDMTSLLLPDAGRQLGAEAGVHRRRSNQFSIPRNQHEWFDSANCRTDLQCELYGDADAGRQLRLEASFIYIDV